jgi:hypothetical protein
MWFKVDDRLSSSRKIKRIPRGIRLAATGLWVLTGSWSAGEELDGAVPDYMLDDFDATPELIDALVACGLWEKTPDGVQFNNWEEYQFTRAELEEKRERERERKAEYREKKRREREGVPADVPPDETQDDQEDTQGTDTHRPDVERLLDILDAEIVRNGSKAPKRNKANRDAMRLLIDRDTKTPEQIEAAIHWCQGDEFWRSNILSATKLREKYDQLRLDAARKQQPQASRKEQRQERNLSTVAQLADIEAARRKGLTA